MKTVRLGELIEIKEERNSKNLNFEFLGINKDKMFMPSVANTDFVDAKKYKIIKKDMFVFSGMQTGRDICIRIGLYQDETPGLLSPAYTTFVVKDKDKILPEYLFLFFNRLEMDRFGAYLSDGSVRANLDWDVFIDIRIPLPSIETQREIVAAYNGLKNVIDDNLAIAEPLEKLCQSFVSEVNKEMPHGFGTANADAFKFKDFALAKSNPRGNIKKVLLGELIEQCDERNSNEKLKIDDVRGVANSKIFIATKADMNGVPLSSYKIVKPKEFCYVNVTSRNGGKISIAIQNENQNVLVSSTYTVFSVKDTNHLLPEYLFLIFNRSEFDRYSRFNSWGSARETFDWAEFCRIKIPLPPIDVQLSIVNIYNCAQEAKRIANEAKEELKKLCPALVQFAAHSA